MTLVTTISMRKVVNIIEHVRIVTAFSILLVLLVAGVSLVGIFTPDFYANEKLSWQVQALGQDIIDLVLVVPILLVTTLIAFNIEKTVVFLWAGILLYIIYTFTIYTFDIHFNKLFILYCIILGIALYVFLYFIYWQIKDPIIESINRTVVKVVGIYFLLIAVFFYFLWLLEIVPNAVNGTTPSSLMESGLPTNPIHVIDLAIFLPGIFITGILLLRNIKLALTISPFMLVFFILMDITIATLGAMMQQRDVEGNYFSLTSAMWLLALFSLVLLVWYMRSMKIKES